MRGARPDELTLTEAATATGLSHDTIKRRLNDGLLPHSRRLDTAPRPWVVTRSDLVAAGLLRPGGHPAARTAHSSPQLDSTGLTLEEAYADALRRLAVAEASARLHEEHAHRLEQMLLAALKAAN